MASDEALFKWPGWMPTPVRAGYAYEPIDRTIKTDMDIGTVRRVEFDTDETKLVCSLDLNREQLAWFEVFERDILRQGTIWFSMPIYISGEIQEHTVRLKERPKFGEVRGFYQTAVSLVLEIEKRKLMDKRFAEFLLCCDFAPKTIRRASRMLHEILHTQACLIKMPELP